MNKTSVSNKLKLEKPHQMIVQTKANDKLRSLKQILLFLQSKKMALVSLLIQSLSGKYSKVKLVKVLRGLLIVFFVRLTIFARISSDEALAGVTILSLTFALVVSLCCFKLLSPLVVWKQDSRRRN